MLFRSNLAGETIVVRKEFVVTQKGDVPSNIQTGSETKFDYKFLVPVLLILLAVVRLRRGKSYE